MTTEEQVPVRLFNFVLRTNVPARTAEEAAARLQRTLDATPEDFQTLWEPAPEETVETTEARCAHADFWYDGGTEYVCYICERRWPAPFPPEPPAPEPAGEAEESKSLEYCMSPSRRCLWRRILTAFPSSTL